MLTCKWWWWSFRTHFLNFFFPFCRYSLALVFWEVYNRLEIGEKANEYAVPFQHLVPSDPSFEDMRQVVCVRGQRPQFVTPPVLDSAASVSASVLLVITLINLCLVSFSNCSPILKV